MKLFEEAVSEIERFISEKSSEGEVQILDFDESMIWTTGSSLVLEEETAVELGNPEVGSFFTVMWNEMIDSGYRITLVGSDVKETKTKKIPFALIILAKGSPRDIYSGWYDLKETVYTLKLDGFMIRILPSKHTIWCRVSNEAYVKRFSLFHLGGMLMRNIKRLDFVSGADLLLVTSGKKDVNRLKDACKKSIRAVEAMLKMNVEMNLDCSSCEYRDVCDSVEELRRMRQELIQRSK